MNLQQMIENGPPRKFFVELTTTGPVLTRSAHEVLSVNSISIHEVTAEVFVQLQELLQTGELDNAKVKSVIKAQQ